MLTRPYRMGSRLAVIICADNLLTLWRNPRDPFARSYFQGEEFERWFVTDPRVILREAAKRTRLQTVARRIRLRRREEVPSLQSRLDEIPIIDPRTGEPQTLVCARCGKTVPKTNGRQKYCRDCQPLVDRELKKKPGWKPPGKPIWPGEPWNRTLSAPCAAGPLKSPDPGRSTVKSVPPTGNGPGHDATKWSTDKGGEDNGRK